MRTTVNINRIHYEKLKSTSEVLGISKDDIISMLLTKMMNYSVFEAKPYETVKYQNSDPGVHWETAHIKFRPVFYEKAQDLKRNFKFSVSWFISYAIINFLNDIVREMTDPEKQKNLVDNYDHNFIYITKIYEGIRVFITLWGVPEKKYLNKLLN